MNEYRWSYITSTQGHYDLHRNLENAIKDAIKDANKRNEPVLVQLWKPTRGKLIYIIKPKFMSHLSKKSIMSWYKDDGYDINYIKPKKYVFNN